MKIRLRMFKLFLEMKPNTICLLPKYIIPIIGKIPQTVSRKRKQYDLLVRDLEFQLTSEKDKDGLPIYDFTGIFY